MDYLKFQDNTTKVYSLLEDDISRKIFINFFTSRFTNNPSFMIEFSSKFTQEKLLELRNTYTLYSVLCNYEGEFHLEDLPYIDKDKTIVIYGAGVLGRKIAAFYNYTKKIIFADCYYKTLIKIDGIDVISEEKAFSKHKDAFFIVATATYSNIFLNNLKKYSIPHENIICPAYVYDKENQYFDFFKPRQDEIFIDAGVYDASSSISFAKWTNFNFNKIYLFEPDLNSYKKSTENLGNEGIKNYEIFDIGLWDKEEVLYFNSNGASSAISGNGDIKISVNSLDNILQEKPVTFIKMDIEGAELNALKGAENIIRKHKPRLAISVYHKMEDIIDIPLYLKSIMPEYKFALRHYTSSFQETVLYAWVD